MTATLLAPAETTTTQTEQAIWMFGNQVSIKVDGTPAGSATTSAEHYLMPRNGKVPRVSPDEDTVLFVLEGMISGY